MIKASAGGGGKGMRIAWNDEQARFDPISQYNSIYHALVVTLFTVNLP